MTQVKKITQVALIMIMLCVPSLLQAQPGIIDDTQDNPVPFDGGVSCLVGVAVLYGLKKAYSRKKNTGEDALALKDF